MAIYKCKMCGGNLEVSDGVCVCECFYCGVQQTVPSADNEKKVNLYNRANRLRIMGEFDKASTIFESLVSEFPEEAEAYWGLCLCNYGVEYVDDPATGKKIPTCHRASFSSLQDDENFKLALEYSDFLAQKIYRDEAREIDRIMGEIVNISKTEKPYDVFICYKETDENGDRTIDSVLAYDIYEALTAKGLKVFFARVSLEDKLGKQYEPYIFAALNSAKVMLCIGTKYEYFQAVWVKNEWSRFLKLMAKDKSKVLIPCFKDIDAYDMPEEFKMLQAQDLGKLGALQDITRGIEKIINADKPSNTSTPAENAPSFISNVCSINTKNYNELWPQGKYSNYINYDEHNVICFHIYTLPNVLAGRQKITLRFSVYNSSGNKITDEATALAWNDKASRISRPWNIRNPKDGSVIPIGKYRAEFSIDESCVFTYNFTVTSTAQLRQQAMLAKQQQEAQLAATKTKYDGPIFINLVTSACTRNYSEQWPSTPRTNIINYDENYVICFFLSVSKSKLAARKKITLKFNVYDEQGTQVLDDETVLNWQSNFDRISKQWIVRGDDGSNVPAGKYKAEFFVDESRVYEYDFYVTSNYNEEMKRRKANELKRQQELRRQNESQKFANQQLIESQKFEAIMRQRRAENLCQHCGSTFKGVLVKVCAHCGKKKDY